MMTMAQGYLVVYNGAQACGWGLLLWRLLLLGNSAIDKELQLAYLLEATAVLEVLHSAFGLVRSGTLTALMQWSGRFHVIGAIATQIQQVHQSHFLMPMLAAWSISEVIRYPQYVFTMLGFCPGWLTWLRYTAFIVLYPIGFASEMGLMYSALPYIKEKKLYGTLFKPLPFGYSEFIVVLLIMYPLVGSLLYKHMLSQRRAKLRTRIKAP